MDGLSSSEYNSDKTVSESRCHANFVELSDNGR